MSADVHQSIQRLFTVDTYVDRGLTFVRGSGVYLLDSQGNKYLDFMSNYGVSIFGYNYRPITSALMAQVKKLVSLHGSFNNDARALAAKALVRRCGHGISQVYFSNSGSEAIEAALKFAVLATEKKQFIVAKHSYHGKTLGALSATYDAKYKSPFAPLLWNFTAVDFGNIDQLRESLTSNVAAVILEPIQGEGGVYSPPPEYLKKVREVCNTVGALLILDEIQTGFGRTGTFLASHQDNIDYDMVCLGKGLAGGIPVGATLVNNRVAQKIPKHIHTSTFGGNPLVCAAISATLHLLDETMLQSVTKKGQYFYDQLEKISSPLIREVRGSGLMVGVEVASGRDEILRRLQIQHILAIPAGENVIRFLPPFLIQKRHINQVVAALTKILKEM